MSIPSLRPCMCASAALLECALENGSDFSTPFDRNHLSATSFPLRLCTSLSVDGGSRSVIALTFEGLALIPCIYETFKIGNLRGGFHHPGRSSTRDSRLVSYILPCMPLHYNQAQSSLLLLDRLDMLVFVCDISIDTTMPIFCIAVLPSRELPSIEAKNVQMRSPQGIFEFYRSIVLSCPWSFVEMDSIWLCHANHLLPTMRGGCSKPFAAFSVAMIYLGLLDRSSPSDPYKWLEGLWRGIPQGFLSSAYERNKKCVVLHASAKFTMYHLCTGFISTEFVPCLNVKPSILKPDYVLEVANGKKVETDRIICGCKLELGDSLFTIDMIPFGHGSFDVIVVMDWLVKDMIAEISFHAKVLEFHWQKINFSKVFPKDLSGFPPQQQVGFRIDLVPIATPFAKISVSTSTIRNARVVKTTSRGGVE
ncbi:putative reverse transcriptase domain-containing protein [Tanacetum coccineum]